MCIKLDTYVFIQIYKLYILPTVLIEDTIAEAPNTGVMKSSKNNNPPIEVWTQLIWMVIRPYVSMYVPLVMIYGIYWFVSTRESYE
jgi:hypothetical protein